MPRILGSDNFLFVDIGADEPVIVRQPGKPPSRSAPPDARPAPGICTASTPMTRRSADPTLRAPVARSGRDICRSYP
jgi:hypothetical protein